jgi:hypothetical protein
MPVILNNLMYTTLLWWTVVCELDLSILGIVLILYKVTRKNAILQRHMMDVGTITEPIATYGYVMKQIPQKHLAVSKYHILQTITPELYCITACMPIAYQQLSSQ